MGPHRRFLGLLPWGYLLVSSLMSAVIVRGLLPLHRLPLPHLDPLESSSWYALRYRSTLHPPYRYGFSAAALVEPTTYREAALYPDWQHAMDEEIAALPPQVTPITCKWLQDQGSNGSVERFKARLVVFSKSKTVTMMRLLLSLLT